MTVQELFDYAKKHNALDYEIVGTSIQCGPRFDVLKVNHECKDIMIKDNGGGYIPIKDDYDFIPHRDKSYEK